MNKFWQKFNAVVSQCENAAAQLKASFPHIINGLDHAVEVGKTVSAVAIILFPQAAATIATASAALGVIDKVTDELKIANPTEQQDQPTQ